MSKLNDLETILNRLISYRLVTDSEIKVIEECLVDIELNLKEATDFVRYMLIYMELTKYKYTPSNDERRLFYGVSIKYTYDELITALTNAYSKNPYYKDKKHLLRDLKYILSPKFVADNINFTEAEVINETKASKKKSKAGEEYL